ncbi:phosphonopyruvate decarboxylase [Streptomyces alboniger]|uniref:phosphonopyruvate decarboxylase n=1 Tax=Streptomyces alboniger TaxID=132473 RepID=UPI0006E1F9B3|nr:phosphonopyruvate decarboxylase [Streptomyces alboniger]
MTRPIEAEEFVEALRAYGVERVTGVPCGHLAGPWTLFEEEGRLVPAASEGAATALAAGWELAGQTAALLVQNSGFGNLINPLTSLLLPYDIPLLVVMTMRGWPDPAQDEPQHAAMGTSTVRLLENLDVPHTVLEPGGLEAALAAASEARAQNRPFFLLVPRGAIGKVPRAVDQQPVEDGELTRPRVVAALMAAVGDDDLMVTTTGYLSRQAHHEKDRDGTFYMQGSMGHAGAIGLGLATAHPERRVVVLDGDGAFLMHLGTGSTMAAAGGANLVHVVVDNGCYESTGCQATTSGDIDWAALGEGLGYRTVTVSRSARSLSEDVRQALDAKGPVLCVFRVVPTPGEVHPRATASTGPADIVRRFRAAATGAPARERRPAVSTS